MENRQDRVVTLTLLRDLDVYAGAMVVEYATSDLTAQGVDDKQYADCLLMSPQYRAAAGCGDYLRSAGAVVFAPGATSAGFTVSIVDDLCRERFMEYIQVRTKNGDLFFASERFFSSKLHMYYAGDCLSARLSGASR